MMKIGNTWWGVYAACMLMSARAETLEIPYRKVVLDNGLTLLVHEDHKTPIVAVNVWYHVGSKDEKPGRTGFAHLFEHLMFNGSEHFNDDYFKAMERVGATGLNGTTGEDRTNYFQEVPRDALDFALWMESDRMGHLLGALTQERLDEQRGVVLNEKRQHDNQPYSIAWRLLTQNTWPAGHPYSWEVIGSEDDLKAATLADVREWFTGYYGAANAVVVVAGDVKSDEVVEKVGRYFGDIPSGPPVHRYARHEAKRGNPCRMKAQDRVSQGRLYKVWNIPPYGSTDGNLLNVAGDVLAGGKTSRLYKRLVYDEQLATDVYAYADLREIAGQFMIVATAKPGVPLAAIERAVDEELARFLSEGPTSPELRRVKAGFEADFVRGCERVGGFGGKSDVLAHNFVFTGDPQYYKTVLKETRDASRTSIRDVARAWLSDGAFVLSLEPFPAYRVSSNGVDRGAVPVPALKPDARLPEIRRAALSNGLQIVLAERHDVPVVQMSLMVDAGYAADRDGIAGTANLVAAMLDEGTRRRSALEISEALDVIGARLETGCGADTMIVSLNTLTRHLETALDIYADVVLEPMFPQADFERLQKQQLAEIQSDKSRPDGVAMRVLPSLLFGKEHAYGVPFNGSGDAVGVALLTRNDMRRFYDAWFKPNNATLLIVGDVTLGEMVPLLERRFGGWTSGRVPSKRLDAMAPASKPTIYLIDRPGAPQSALYSGVVAPPLDSKDQCAVEVMNSILGGSFTSRINLNLREEKHWSYGARTRVMNLSGPRVFLCSAPVQADKTIEALLELRREFCGIVSDRLPTEAEREKAVTDLTLRLGGQWETIGAVMGVLGEMTRFHLPEEYFRSYADTVRGLSINDVSQAAVRVVRPESLVWLVVGDRAKIEPGLRGLGWGPVTVLDADGKRVP
ncbi:MAG TPA: pitrilysin family protein [Kiritimatiellia bacterium]|nr:pitrilysin family protein [Kiritimatiellia bacterium]HPS06554.1 pitrilysin family protein [Kiritimatiellia bacterium]